MSVADVIVFLCPACNAKLTVPGIMGGVAGPCPACQVLIQAPFSMTRSVQQPVYQQHPRAPEPAYNPQRTAPLPEYSRTPQPVTGQPTVLRPEPRQLPSPEPAPAQVRVRTEPSGVLQPRAGNPGPPPQRHHRNRFLRLMVPVTFLCVALGVMYGVKTFLQMDRSGNSKDGKKTAEGGKVEPVANPSIEPENNSFAALTETKGQPVLPVGEPAMPVIGDIKGDFPPEFHPVDGGIAALKLLEEFLAMKTLEERMPHIETKRTEQELISSPLNGVLPEVMNITVDVRETNAIEQVIDYYYHVDFASGDGGSNPQTMLVRTRGTSPPKVVVDPFMDLFGGRFARYAEKPVEDAGTFQVIISAGAFCYDDVPGAEKKFTLDILATDHTKEIAKAYFGKNSNIGYMLKDESSGFTYGLAKPCTVFMRWNTEEDPERPFLEALDIKALDWNP